MSALRGFVNYSSGDSEISDEEDEYTAKLVKRSPPSGLGNQLSMINILTLHTTKIWSRDLTSFVDFVFEST